MALNSGGDETKRGLAEVEALFPKAMLRDQKYVQRKLEQILRSKTTRRSPFRLGEQLDRLSRILRDSALRKSGRASRKPFISYPAHLPIVSKKDEIVGAIKENQILIISGETGSGKSTQIPKMCLEAGKGIDGIIGCTQPRRIAATTIAHRIAEELAEPIGKSVGYKIRFSDKTSPDAYIKIMTDGILLAETQKDPNLYEYDTLIIDEAHERSINIDFLLGLLKKLLVLRPELKLIISSATLETEKFSSFFDNAPVIQVSGKIFPVEVKYMPVDPDLEEKGELTYIDMALRAVEQIRLEDRFGDILIFMPTEQDILETCERLTGHLGDKTYVLPLFARLPAAHQRRIYTVKGPKVVVATNVAETSLTIPGIRYVIDTGLARIARYVARTRTTSLPISPISQASADQRKGRCGRVQRGVCIRLYSEEDYENRPTYTVPEILRANLAEVILRMMYLRLGDIQAFPFLDKPSPRSIKDGFDLLMELGAIEREGQGFRLTRKGKMMARIPMDPRISRMLLEAQREGCLKEVAVIASALSIQDPRERPLDRQEEVDQAHSPFKDPDSDFITLLNMWNHYCSRLKTLRTQGKMRKFCRENFLSFTRMREWVYVHDQINQILKEYGISRKGKDRGGYEGPLYDRIHRSILSGLLSNIALKKEKNLYRTTKGREAMIFPGSGLFNRDVQWIVAAEMVKTSRLYARTVAKIDPVWLEPLAGQRCTYSYSHARWSPARGEVVAEERVSLYGLPIIEKRTVSYGKINPKEAHEIFIMEALVQGRVGQAFPFLTHNQETLERLKAVEDKVRRRDIVVGEDDIFRFYSERLTGVYDIRTLKKRIKERGGDDFLKMQEEDLLLRVPGESIISDFPDTVSVKGHVYRCLYSFSPGSPEDGVTLSIPVSMASEFPASRLDWVVPGLLREKIKELIRALPKQYRRQLVPVSTTVDVIAKEMRQEDVPLAVALTRFIERRFGIHVPVKIWSTLEIPDHLKMRISITDLKGEELVLGRDPSLLQKASSQMDLSDHEAVAWRQARERWEKTGAKEWDFGEIPERISIDEYLIAYPGLEKGEGGVNLRLFRTSAEAFANHQKGIQALYCIKLAKELRFVKKTMKLPEDARPGALYFGGAQVVEEALFEHLLRHCFAKNIRTRQAFYDNLKYVKSRLYSDTNSLVEVTRQILKGFHEARARVSTIAREGRENKELLRVCEEITSDLAELVPNDFLGRYTIERLEHLPRYIKAMLIRAERAAYDLEKDKRKREQLEGPLRDLRQMMYEFSHEATPEKREAIESYRWMIEEFRVSLFAQELKTAYPVSLQRLRQKKEEIDRMI